MEKRCEEKKNRMSRYVRVAISLVLLYVPARTFSSEEDMCSNCRASPSEAWPRPAGLKRRVVV